MMNENHVSAIAPTLIDLRAGFGPAPLLVESFGLTDRGKERAANEDQFVIAALTGAMWIQQSSFAQTQMQYGRESGHLFVVADGMGGHAGGEKASALAVGTIEQLVLGALEWLFAMGNEGDLLQEFKNALRRADARVCDEASKHPELRGMGTTLTMAYCFGAELFVAHAGDSRCYMMRGGALSRLTEDHTLVREMVKGGVLREADVAAHELRHVVTNVVGGPTRGVKAELRKTTLLSGDRLLLCTDGLTEMLAEDEIAALLTRATSARGAAEALVARANELGGRDNVTVIVAGMQGAPEVVVPTTTASVLG